MWTSIVLIVLMLLGDGWRSSCFITRSGSPAPVRRFFDELRRRGMPVDLGQVETNFVHVLTAA
jgi:hypothetical protein